MSSKKLKLDFEITISDVVDLNKSFAAAKCMVCYTGRNRNYSDIRKQKIIDAIPSIKNIPVVGRYDPDKDDFGSHDIKIVNKEDGIDIVNATIPFGIVPESAKQWFEIRVVKGQERECFFTDILLWKRQYGYEHIAEAKTISESMEIDVSEYVVDQDGYCIVEKFAFEALCLLGSDVEPCFENACVQMYSKEIVTDFKLQFSEMLKEIKKLNLSSDEEVQIDKEKEVENPMATEDIKVDEVEDNVAEVLEDNVAVIEDTEVNVTDTTEDNQNDNGEPSEDYKALYEELKAQHDALGEEYSEYKENHTYENSEYEALSEFRVKAEKAQREADETAIFSEFEDEIGKTNEFAELKEKAGDYTIDALKKECLCIVGAYARAKSKANTLKKAEGALKFSVEIPTIDDDKDPYGGIMKKYLGK